MVGWNRDFALIALIKLLKDDKPELQYKNKFGHALIETQKGNYYFLFKKSHFMTFSREFRGFLGIGESINREYLEMAVEQGAELVFTYQDASGVFYGIDRAQLIDYLPEIMNKDSLYTATLLKVFCKRNGLIRGQDKENKYKLTDYTEEKQGVNEVTYSFPIKLFKRLDYKI